MSVEPKLLLCWAAGGLQVLVPKRRGKGYLSAPYGHHANKGLDTIAELAMCDLFGLDGALYFDCGWTIFHGQQGTHDEFIERVRAPLEAHYKMPSQLIGVTEFWELHPHNQDSQQGERLKDAFVVPNN